MQITNLQVYISPHWRDNTCELEINLIGLTPKGQKVINKKEIFHKDEFEPFFDRLMQKATAQIKAFVKESDIDNRSEPRFEIIG